MGGEQFFWGDLILNFSCKILNLRGKSGATSANRLPVATRLEHKKRIVSADEQP